MSKNDRNLTFRPEETGVLAMDCQNGIVSLFAKPPEQFIERAAGVLTAARRAGMTVIHVQVGFRPGLPEISSRNKLFSAIKSSAQHQQLFQGDMGAVHSALGPEPQDIVVTKHRVSAFRGTDLEMILSAREIDTLLMFGIATSGVVLSTLLDACDRDYQIFVVSDCCADMDGELHASLLERLFPRRAEVITAKQFIEAV